MSETSTRTVDERATLRHNPRHNRNVARKLAKAVHMSILVDYRQQVEKAAEYIGACLEAATGNPDLRGAYTVLKSWYCHASARAPKPSRVDMAKVTGDYAVLYRREFPTPPGDRCIPTSKL